MFGRRTISGLLFPVSLKPVGDHISTRSAARKRNLLREYRPRPQGTSSTITAMAQKQTPATYRMLRFFGAVIVVARIVGIVSAVLGLVLQDGYASASVQIIIFGLILIVAGVGLYRWCQRRVGNS